MDFPTCCGAVLHLPGRQGSLTVGLVGGGPLGGDRWWGLQVGVRSVASSGYRVSGLGKG